MIRMIRTALWAVALILIAPMLNARPATAGDGHVLTALWKQYEAASKADRPQQEAEVLEKIKKESQKQHLPADFYDAATKYVEVVLRRDWKKADAARETLKQEVAEFNDPLVTFLWMGDAAGASSDARWTFVKERATAFRAGHNPSLYRGVDRLMGGVLQEYMDNDYEFALWHLLIRTSPDGEIGRTLSAEIAGKYPAEGFLEYYIANRGGVRAVRRAALEAVANRYAGKAVALWPRQEMLQIDFELLNRDDAKAAAYEDLYNRCLAYEKERGALRGQEARIASACTSVKGLCKTLTAKEVRVSLADKSAVVSFRNLDKATLTLLQDRTRIKTWNLTNPARSFYVYDTVKVELPRLGDGSYSLEAENGKLSDIAWYNQHTLSLAVRREAGGYAAYVADYLSGKPLDKARLILWKGDQAVASKTVSLDGFTLLPREFTDTIKKNRNTYYTLSAETGSGKTLRASGKLNVYSYGEDTGGSRSSDGTYCRIYRDRGAYNPGDVLQFKVVVYRGNLVDQVSVVPDKAVEVVLTDSEGNEVGRKKLKTNEFGSVSGSFTLPVGARNGHFGLTVRSGKTTLAADAFRVDEFVLPTFSLSFDPTDQLYLKGDVVQVTGQVRSYSGHSLGGATLSVQVRRWNVVVLDQDIRPEADGSFAFTFPAEDTGYYDVEVTVTDATGETQEFGTGVYVSDHIRVSLSMRNAADGEFVSMDEKDTVGPVRYIGRRWWSGPSEYVLSEGVARVNMQVNNSDGNRIDVPLTYTLYAEDSTVVCTGKAASGEEVAIDLTRVPDGLYSLHAEATERTAIDKEDIRILKLSPGAKVLDAPVRRVFLTGPADVPLGEKIRLTLGTADGAEYAIVTLFGLGRQVLETRKVVLKGVRGQEGSLTTVELDYKADYPDAVRLQVFYFKRGEDITFDREFSRTRTRLALPLQFDRFTDKAFPGTSQTITLKTDPGVEALAAVFDKSLDAIAPNGWSVVTLRSFSVPYVSVNAVCGEVNGDNPYEPEVYEEATVGSMAMMKTTRSAISLNSVEDAVNMEEYAVSTEGAEVSKVTVRSKFETALTFQPHLTSDADGNLSFTFDTSDKLSTYYVQVYAHDKDMRNAFVRQEMVVSVPVKVSVVEPQFLYAGDSYEMAVSVSGNTDKPVSGQLYLYLYPSGAYEGVEPVAVQRVDVTVPAGGTESHRFPVRVPAVETLGFKAVFAAKDFSDAVFVPVPVKKPVQALTEAHSAVLRSGMDRESLLADLRARFVNVPASEAALTETTLLDLVRAAIPDKADPAGNDVLSLSEAYYVRLVASRLGVETGDGDTVSGAFARIGSRSDAEETVSPSPVPSLSSDDLLERILACRNDDGGFGWFEGMNSSSVITAVLLSRFAKLRDHGFEVPDLASSVLFLDKDHFTATLPVWRGYVSDAQYMFVRSLYPEVPFTVNPVTKEEKKILAAFQKDAKAYLVPSAKDGRGLQGRIMAKGRRVQTLLNLSASSAGVALAKAWGVKVAAKVKMEASLKADIASLKEYAVEHRDGGWYYPNAVMPWRGLLETEADAHALLCGLMQPYAPQISDGIRLWLMLQKETQKWDESPAYVDAITAILDGSDEVLSTTILSLSASYEKPFADIRAAGNGFTVERRFFRRKTTSDSGKEVSVLEEIQRGTPVAVGDRIVAEYRIWNAENRSFVRVDAFREAALRPVEQLSGHTGWSWWRSRGLTYAPQGYRNVKADRTEYYFDSFPEENTTISEEFFVTQAGTFTAPVITVESLYAPHYCANDAFHGVLAVE